MKQERVQKLIFELQNGTDRQRRAASYKLRNFKDPIVVQALIKAYTDPDYSVRQNVTNALRLIGNKEAQEFLISHNQSIQVSKSTGISGFLFVIVSIVCLLLLTGGYILIVGNSLSKQCAWEGSAFTFVDKNADGKYQEGETPLSGITINLTRPSLQTRQFTTDKYGIANLIMVFMGCPDLEIEVGVDTPEGMQLTTSAIYQIENPKNDERFIFGLTYMSGTPTLTPSIESP
jgi:hypothetical protein